MATRSYEQLTEDERKGLEQRPWQKVGLSLSRIRIPGGYLYRLNSTNEGTALVFVPFGGPGHNYEADAVRQDVWRRDPV